LQLCEDRLGELKRLRKMLPQRVRESHGVATAQATLTRAERRLQHLQAQSAETAVISPACGTVQPYLFKVGEFVPKGKKLTEIVDGSRRFLIVQVPADKLIRFRQGETVRLRFPDGEKRIGKIGKRQNRSPQSAETIPIRIDAAGKLWPSVPLGTAVDVIVGK